ncbi:hypothetical protein GGI43DRAFT_405892 [Trichoderma evansii]
MGLHVQRLGAVNVMKLLVVLTLANVLNLVSPSPASSPTCPGDLVGELFCAFPRGSSLALFILRELTNPGFAEGSSNHEWPSGIAAVVPLSIMAWLCKAYTAVLKCIGNKKPKF